MVPAALLPPATPLTCQVTAVLDVPVTVAVNCSVAPAATFADVGEIETATALLGVEGEGPEEAEGAAEPPPQPAPKRERNTAMNARGLE
jgi:hypothetical protein